MSTLAWEVYTSCYTFHLISNSIYRSVPSELTCTGCGPSSSSNWLSSGMGSTGTKCRNYHVLEDPFRKRLWSWSLKHSLSLSANHCRLPYVVPYRFENMWTSLLQVRHLIWWYVVVLQRPMLIWIVSLGIWMLHTSYWCLLMALEPENQPLQYWQWTYIVSIMNIFSSLLVLRCDKAEEVSTRACRYSGHHKCSKSEWYFGNRKSSDKKVGDLFACINDKEHMVSN